jgi:4-carboxymuconolactone decarboxylase
MTKPTNERHAPIQDHAWPAEIADMLSGFAGGLNVYRTMAHHPALLAAWSNLREHIVNQTTLGAQRSEVVILRTGTRLNSSYEWHQHIIRARKCGMDDGRIASLGGAISGMSPDDAIIASAVDDLFANHKISSGTEATLRALVGTYGVLDVIATVGFYSTLGYILNTFDTPLDENIAAELVTNPLAT